MARARAADYSGKRQALLDGSAALFARNGYDRTSMAEVAAASGVSKALLYHYYVSKETLLYDILHHHLQELVDAVDAVDRALEPRAYLRALVGALLDAYRVADDEHKIQLNELAKLPAGRRKALQDLERELVRIFSEAIAAANPMLARDDRLLKPVTMSLFGMLNWKYMWFREEGAMSSKEYADLATTMILDGTVALSRNLDTGADASARRPAAGRGRSRSRTRTSAGA